MNAVTARTVCHGSRTHSRRETVIAVLITTYSLAGDSKFLSKSDAFMTSRTSFSRDHRRCRCAVCVNWCHDIVNPMAISAHGRSRYTTRHCLSVNALHKLGAFTLVTLAAREGDVDFGDG